MKYKMTNEIKQLEYLKACEFSRNGLTKKEIIENTLFPTWRVLEFYMERNSLKLPFMNMKKTHKSDSLFFEKIDSFEKAYILGFLYADGCVYNDHRFGFCLAKQDEEVIDYIKNNICPTALKKEINNTKGTKNRQPQIQLRISDHRLVKDLKEKWGVYERKTLNSGLVFPNIENKYLWNFILGLNDGDGNIYYQIKTKDKYPVLRIAICMTDLSFMEKLKDFLISENVDIRLYERQGKTCKYYLLNTPNNNSALEFCHKIYTNRKFCLQRKLDKYLDYCKLNNIRAIPC